MCRPPPDAENLAQFGLTPDDVDGGVVEIWPDNLEAFELFYRMATQWRIGMSGPTGLDHATLHAKMDRMGLTAERYDELEDEIIVMEYAGLEAFREKD